MMTEADLLTMLYGTHAALDYVAAGRLTQERFARLGRDPKRLAPIGSLLVLIDPGVHTFVQQDARRLVTLLSRRTCRIRETVAEGNGVRGRVDWSATARVRASHPFLAADTVCRIPRIDYDRLENRLLTYLIDLLAGCDRLAGDLCTYACKGDAADRWAADRTRLIGMLAELRRNLPPGYTLPTPTIITAEHLVAARIAASRVPEYGMLERVYRRCAALVLQPEAKVWQASLAQTPVLAATTHAILFNDPGEKQ